MLINLVRIIKNKILISKFGSILIAKIYVIYHKYILKKKYFKIFKSNDYWIHETEIGFLPYRHPIFNSDLYIKTNYEIFFEKYKPKKNDCVVELGAGVGSETLFISKLIGNKGRIISAEPFNNVYDLLSQTIKINNLDNVILIEKALYKSKSNIGFSSDPNNWLGGKISKLSQDKVSTFTLNDLVLDHQLIEVNYCKINIEGAEKYITSSSSNFFKICKNLAIECHDFLPGSDYKTYDEIKSFLLNNNFKVTRSKRNKFPWDKFFIFAEK